MRDSGRGSRMRLRRASGRVLRETIALLALVSAPLSAQSRDNGWMFAVVGGPGVATPTPFVFSSGDTLYRTRKRPMLFELEISKTLRRSSGKKLFYEYFVAS